MATPAKKQVRWPGDIPAFICFCSSAGIFLSSSKNQLQMWTQVPTLSGWLTPRLGWHFFFFLKSISRVVSVSNVIRSWRDLSPSDFPRMESQGSCVGQQEESRMDKEGGPWGIRPVRRSKTTEIYFPLCVMQSRLPYSEPPVPQL